jgi:predicted transcriptional regulator of viral defense system
MTSKLNKLLLTKRNVFNLDDMGVIWGQTKRSDTVQSARDYTKKGILKRVKRGVYVIDKSYNNLELAQKIEPLSYISGVTALSFHGLSFQYYRQIQAAALKMRVHEVDGTKFIYRQLRAAVFFNRLGLQKATFFTIASPERAIGDILYWQADFQFENLTGIDWDKLRKVGEIYQKKSVLTAIDRLERAHRYA